MDRQRPAKVPDTVEVNLSSSDEDEYEDSVLTIDEISGVKLPEVSTPASAPLTRELPWTSTPRMAAKESDEVFQKIQAQLNEAEAQIRLLQKKCKDHEKQMEDLTKVGNETSHITAVGTSTEKLPLPPKYEGTIDFANYLAQFEALASEQAWTTAKKGVILLSRLKGRALDVAVQGEGLTYGPLVERLRAHFSPDHEEMYAQKLQAVQKQPTQTWEDLAFEVKNLASKAYKATNEATKERLATHALVNAISDDGLRQKVRDSHPGTIEQALQRVRQVEADQVIEKQRCQNKEPPKKDTAHNVQTEASERVHALEEQVRKLQVKLEEKSGAKGRGETSPRGRRGRGGWRPGRGRGFRTRPASGCFFCGGPDHFQRECPSRIAWAQQQQAMHGPREAMNATPGQNPNVARPPYHQLN